ncbi:WG repeat-containing protein [Aureispira sp. CCB-E]|uniref:WG repeat-containing protein n=1 Tax=Aureispira sp. CCB-E TaxID=3051121 RepID=UPI002868C99C|nr:WG repeat-containing protein [Aureispira sp. CCB-E]WMX13852.1 WG repeat-containing protein [Aureispira sp. CCB-E]
MNKYLSIRIVLIHLCSIFLSNISLAQGSTQYFFIVESNDGDVSKEYIFNELGGKLFKEPKSSIYFNDWDWMIVGNKDKTYTVFCPPKYQHSIKDIQTVPSMAHMRSSKTTLFPLKKAGKWGFYNKKGLAVITHKFDFVSEFYKGMAAVKIGENAYYINAKGEKVNLPYRSKDSSYSFYKYEEVLREPPLDDYYRSHKDENFNITTEDNKIGLKNSRTEEVIIPCIYDRILQMGDILEYFIVVKDEKWGLYSAEGKKILEPIYDLIQIEKISIKN